MFIPVNPEATLPPTTTTTTTVTQTTTTTSERRKHKKNHKKRDPEKRRKHRKEERHELTTIEDIDEDFRERNMYALGNASPSLQAFWPLVLLFGTNCWLFR